MRDEKKPTELSAKAGCLVREAVLSDIRHLPREWRWPYSVFFSPPNRAVGCCTTQSLGGFPLLPPRFQCPWAAYKLTFSSPASKLAVVRGVNIAAGV